jgi:hypothetical protein
MNPLEDPPTRATLAMALLALLLVAAAIVGLAMWGGRWVRRSSQDLRRPLPDRPRLRPENTPPQRFAIDPNATARPGADDTVVDRPGETSPGGTP